MLAGMHANRDEHDLASAIDASAARVRADDVVDSGLGEASDVHGGWWYPQCTGGSMVSHAALVAIRAAERALSTESAPSGSHFSVVVDRDRAAKIADEVAAAFSSLAKAERVGKRKAIEVCEAHKSVPPTAMGEADQRSPANDEREASAKGNCSYSASCNG